jgi:hypothetical protein
VPAEAVELTAVTVGAVVSITIVVLALREPEAPGDANVSTALVPAALSMLPPFKVKELVDE